MDNQIIHQILDACLSRLDQVADIKETQVEVDHNGGKLLLSLQRVLDNV